MPEDNENKGKFSSTTLRILKKAAARPGVLNEKHTENQLPDAQKPMWLLRPESPEFKRRINEENFRYVMEAETVYVSQLMAKRESDENARLRDEFLSDYHHQLEKEKTFFQNLNASEKNLNEKLFAEQKMRLDLLNKKLDDAIKLLTTQINQIQSMIQNNNAQINQLTINRQQQVQKLSNILRQYAASNIPINNAQNISIPLTFTPAQLAQAPQALPQQMNFNEDHIRKMLFDAADKLDKGELSFTSQANEFQNIVKENLKSELYNQSQFLPHKDREVFVQDFMNSEQSAQAIHTLSKILGDHFEHMDKENEFQFKLTVMNIGSTDKEINKLHTNNKSLTQLCDELAERRDVFQNVKNTVDEAIKNDTSLSPKQTIEFNKVSNDLDDFLSENEPVSKLIANSGLPEKEEAKRFTQT